jgi:hypothetical protein
LFSLLICSSKGGERARDAWMLATEAVGVLPVAVNTSDVGFGRCQNMPNVSARTAVINAVPTVELYDYFLGMPSENQVLCLIHELIHVRLLTGPFHEHHLVTESRWMTFHDIGHGPCDRQRRALMGHLANYIDEVAAEVFLRHHYPNLASKRAANIAGAFLKREWAAVAVPELRCLAVLLDLLQARLALMLGQSAELRAALEGRVTMAESALMATMPIQQAEILALIPRLLQVDVDSGAFDNAAHDHLMRIASDVSCG